jgi:hypothetical protein|tara:strand:- start:246 stop:449 length:204 start_codon:yes stop_codon:yes gene_type:complete
MNKTINVGEGTENVQINQTIAQPEPSGPSVGGVSLTTGYGWGVDVGIILLIVGFLYVMKKFVDKWIK